MSNYSFNSSNKQSSACQAAEQKPECLHCYSTERRGEGATRSKYSPSGFNHFLCDIVEEVPAAEGKGGLQESQSDLPNRRRPVQGKGHLRSQRLVVAWNISPTVISQFGFLLLGGAERL